MEAIEKIGEFIQGMAFEEFTSNRTLLEAVLFNLVVIGEAANRVPVEIRSRHPSLPWEDMRSNRNFVVHEYFRVSPRIIWGTISQDLPPLMPLLLAMLEAEVGDE
jgi:uncharacterized protein with HEPN domain